MCPLYSIYMVFNPTRLHQTAFNPIAFKPYCINPTAFEPTASDDIRSHAAITGTIYKAGGKPNPWMSERWTSDT